MKKEHLNEIPENWSKMAKVFEAMGNEYRQKILLLFEKGEELSIKDLVDFFPLKRTSLVHHLQILQNAEILIATKKGKYLYLKINPDIVIESCNKLIQYALTIKE